eukprot:TRINITY_DN2597_c0_g2_i2.p1 TRINITY_DN2597_c0_g2~~TRINITY_DN2597_c0_g2_i2.p1  ORF type:complete len:190 (+),score=6.54 TRINITY_DN2597_c0_g2_i2:274-843(+)
MGCGASRNKYVDNGSRSELPDTVSKPLTMDEREGNMNNTTAASLGCSQVETSQREREKGEMMSPTSYAESPPASMDGDRSFSLDENDPEIDIKASYQKLLEQALEAARSKGATTVKVGLVPIQNIGPSVELTHSELSRIRQWCDFNPPFEPILTLEGHQSNSGRAPRDHNLQQNQDLLDNHYLQKKKKP